MQAEKIRCQVDRLSRFPSGFKVTGYEIHHGVSHERSDLFPFAACSSDQQVWGSYVHGLFEQGAFRKAWLSEIGYSDSDGKGQHRRIMASLDLLADTLGDELNPALLAPLLQRTIAT